jgi:hypothetical protein
VNLRNGMPFFRQLRVVLLHLLGSIVLRGGWDLDMPLSPHYLRRIRSPPYIQGALRDHCSGEEATKSIEHGSPRSRGVYRLLAGSRGFLVPIGFRARFSRLLTASPGRRYSPGKVIICLNVRLAASRILERGHDKNH